jgi:hypothetical protein
VFYLFLGIPILVGLVSSILYRRAQRKNPKIQKPDSWAAITVIITIALFYLAYYIL